MEGKTNKTPILQKQLFSEEEDNETLRHYRNIWKVALWGTNHDYTLLQELEAYPSLEEVVEQLGWLGPQGGFNRSGPGELQPFPWLDGALLLQGEDFTQYGINEDLLQRMPEKGRYYRGGNPKLFKAPFVLFKRGQVQRRPGAAFSNIDFVYTTAITGISGPDTHIDLLKALAALLNSDFAQYFWFLTSSSWGVEREEITAGELKNLPFPFLSNKKLNIKHIADLVDRMVDISKERSRNKLQHFFSLYDYDYELSQRAESLERELNQNIYSWFGLNNQEVQIINDTVQYTISFFNSPDRSFSLQRPPVEMQKSYADTFIQSINFYLNPIGRKLVATVFTDEALPMLGVQFTSKPSYDEVPDIQVSLPDIYMRQALPNLHKLSFEKSSKSFYLRRNFRVYENAETFSIFKPAERRLWTTSAALSDADETVAELLQPRKVLK